MTDAKVATLYQNHRQFGSIRQLPEKVEGIRSQATLWGAGTSLALLLGNELSRFTLRSPIFKLKPVALLAVLVAPTAYFKYLASSEAESEVQKYWRIHKVREEKGLGGSYKADGRYPYMAHNAKLLEHTPINIHMDELVLGKNLQTLPDNDNLKLNEAMVKYSAFHDDWDKNNVFNTFEESDRLKKFRPKEGIKYNTWFMKPMEDTDQKFKEGGIDNDHLFHEPPDKRFGPSIDFKMDEKMMFKFSLDIFGNEIVGNDFYSDMNVAMKDYGKPWWSDKMFAVDIIDDDTRKEYEAQCKMRQEFNALKYKQFVNALNGELTKGKRLAMDAEMSQFIEKAREDRVVRDLEGTFVSDHSPRPKRLHTNNEQEDLDFFNYEQKLKQFHAGSAEKVLSNDEKDWEHPMKTLHKKAHTDFSKKMLEKYDGLEPDPQEYEEPEADEEIVEQAEKIVEDLGPFKEGEEYDAIKDMKDAFKNANKKSLADQIFETLPHHSFLDVKTPLKKYHTEGVNRFNPSKPKNAYTFFEHRKNWQYLEDCERHPNLKTSISSWVPF